MARHTVFNDVNESETWCRSLAFLFSRAVRPIDLGPVRMTGDEPEVTVATDPRFQKMRVTITLWVERK